MGTTDILVTPLIQFFLIVLTESSLPSRRGRGVSDRFNSRRQAENAPGNYKKWSQQDDHRTPIHPEHDPKNRAKSKYDKPPRFVHIL